MLHSTRTIAAQPQTAVGRARARFLLGPLVYPAYRRYWAAGFLSFTAFWIQMIVRGWMVQDMTGSPFLVTLVPVTMMLPMLFLSLAGGVLADKLDRRRIILTTEAGALVGYVALSIIVALGVAQVWHVLALSTATGIAFAIAGPARMALVPSLVPKDRARSAVALSAVVFSVAQMIGPAIGGVLIARLGTDAALFSSIAFVAPAWLLYSSIDLPKGAYRPRLNGSPLKSVQTGLVYTFRDPTLRGLMLGGLVVAITFNTWPALMPTFVQGVLSSGPEALGTLTVVAGAGALVGSLLVVAIADRVAHQRVEYGAAVLFAAAVAGFAASPWFALSVVAAGFAGLAQAGYFVTNMSVAQMATTDEMRGRVMSIRFLIFGLQPIGALALGALAEAAGVRGALYWFAAVGLVAFVLVQFLTRSTRAPAGARQPDAAPDEATPAVRVQIK